MHRPASVTLSAQEGEAMIERLAAYAPSVADCQVLIKVLRWHFWLVCALQEAKRRLKRLRTFLCGKAPKPPTPPEADALSASTHPDGHGAGEGEP